MHAFNPSTLEAEEDLCEFEASQVYIRVPGRLNIQWDVVSRLQKVTMHIQRSTMVMFFLKKKKNTWMAWLINDILCVDRESHVSTFTFPLILSYMNAIPLLNTLLNKQITLVKKNRPEKANTIMNQWDHDSLLEN